MRCNNTFNTFWCCNEEQTDDFFASSFFKQVDGRDKCTTGCKHRIQNNRGTLINVFCELNVVFFRLKSFFITEHTNDANFNAWNHIHKTVQHTNASTENWNYGSFLSFNLVYFYRTSPSFDGTFLCFEIFGCFVGEKTTNFIGKCTEFSNRNICFANSSEFMFDQRMVNHVNSHIGLLGRLLEKSGLKRPRLNEWYILQINASGQETKTTSKKYYDNTRRIQ